MLPKSILLLFSVIGGIFAEIQWEARVVTSHVGNAGTDADVYIQIIGTEGKTGNIFIDNEHENFEVNDVDTFVFTTPDIGTPTNLRVWHDNSGEKPGWHLARIELRRLKSNSPHTFVFNCNCWLAKDEGDRKIDRTLAVAKSTWRVWVKTSDIEGASTDGQVSMVIYGTHGMTRQIPLSHEGDHFRRGTVDVFTFSTVDVGSPNKVRVVTQHGDPWHLDRIELENLDGAKMYDFDCHCLLGLLGNTTRLIPVSSSNKDVRWRNPDKQFEKIDRFD